MSTLSIFTSPKPFTDPHISTIQLNAIRSWKALGERVDVWLVGEEDGVESTAKLTGVHYLPQVERTSGGTPRIDSIFNAVRAASTAPFLCYVNADILLFQDLLETLQRIIHQTNRFLVVGQRWDINVVTPLDFSVNWADPLLENLPHKGILHPATGSDYFIFPRELFMDLPPFAVGRIGWDNYMIFHGRREHLHVIDATGSITAVHQNHDFRHLPGGRKHRLQPESLENFELAGGRATLFSLQDVTHKMFNLRLVKPPLTVKRLRREFSILPLLNLHPLSRALVVYRFLNPFQARRDENRHERMKAKIANPSRRRK